MDTGSKTGGEAAVTFASLRRWSLLTLVGGVVGLGAIGVLLLLFAPDTDTVYRVFGTVAVLAISSGTMLGFVSLGERRRIPMWYFWVVLLGATGFSALSIAAIWWPNFHGAEDTFISALTFLAVSLLATPVAVALRARRPRFACLAGFALIGLHFAWFMGDIWFQIPRQLATVWSNADELSAAMWVLAFVPTHASLVLLIDNSRAPRWLRWSTIVAGGCTGLSVATLILFRSFDSELAIRLVAVFAIIATCLSILICVVSYLVTSRARAALGAAIPIELTCPACRSHQSLRAGESACSQCGCAFSIRITPKNCITCGYSLANLRARTCPECGGGF